MVAVEKKEWDGHEEVLNLISEVPMLRAITKQIKKNDEKDILDDILWSLIFHRRELKRQFEEGPFVGGLDKKSIYQYTKEYIDSSFAHNPYLTNSIIEQIIDIELLQLEYDIKSFSEFGYFNIEAIALSNTLKSPWNRIASIGVFSLIAMISISIIAILVANGYLWVALIVCILSSWHYAVKFISYVRSQRLKNKYSLMEQKLRAVRNEITSHSFDPKTISERIKKLENEGLYISSLIYPLLEIGQK